MCISGTVPVAMGLLSSLLLEGSESRIYHHRNGLYEGNELHRSVVLTSWRVEVPERDQHEGKFGVLESRDVLQISGGRVKSERRQFFEGTYSRVQWL